jgi:hypothetical protein
LIKVERSFVYKSGIIKRCFVQITTKTSAKFVVLPKLEAFILITNSRLSFLPRRLKVVKSSERMKEGEGEINYDRQKKRSVHLHASEKGEGEGKRKDAACGKYSSRSHPKATCARACTGRRVEKRHFQGCH